MPRLRFPPREPRQPDSSALPPELRWDAPQESVALLLSRRQFLRAAAVVLGLLALPYSRAERAWARAKGRFFTRSERATLDALCDRIIPPDDVPGASALGAGRYIEIMLSAFDGGGTPRIYAGGPFSGRNPYPDNKNGTPSKRRPRNSFKHFVELTRLQDLTWRGEILGTAAVPELAAFDAQFGAPKTGLRRGLPGAASPRWTRSRRRRRVRLSRRSTRPSRTPCSRCSTAAPSCPIHGAVA